MLTTELHKNIDKRWEACWPINMLRPLVLIDLISYLLFIKKIEERQLIPANWNIRRQSFHKKETMNVSWSSLKEMDATICMSSLQKRKACMRNKKLWQANRQYSLFVKEPLILTPTVKLLANMVEIVKIMEEEDSDTMAAIFEYLLNKAEITGPNGQVYAPDYVIKLVVALMRPSPADVIGDPSAGNGSLLINSATYIAGKNPGANNNYKNSFASGNYKGIESDLIQLRIGAMNMILHGIEDPKLGSLHVLSKTNLSLREKPTLVLSNLFFEGTEDNMAVNGNALQTKATDRKFVF